MRYLIDTHVLIWYFREPRQIAPDVASLLRSADNTVLASAVSRHEISIKAALGKLSMPPDWDEAVESYGFVKLPVTWAHARAVEVLPPIHRDPFDRLLVAQAMVEDAILVSSDPQLFRYPVRTLRASP